MPILYYEPELRVRERIASVGHGTLNYALPNFKFPSNILINTSLINHNSS